MKTRNTSEDIDFQKYWLILKRHWLPGTAVWGSTIILALAVALFAGKNYEAYGKLRFQKENATSALALENGEKIGKLDSLNMKDTPVDTEAEVISSAPIVNKVIDNLKLTDDEGEAIEYDDFLRNLKVKSVRGTDVLRVAYRHKDRQKAQKIVDELIKVYLEQNVGYNRSEAAAARKFIEEQLPRTEKNVEQAEKALRDFQEENRIVDLNQESKETVAQISQLERQIDKTEAALENATGSVRELENKLGISSQQALVLNTVNDSPAIQRLVRRLKDVEDELASARSIYQEQNPAIESLKSQKESLEAQLQTRINETFPNRSVSLNVFQTGDVQENLTEELVNKEVERRSLSQELQALKNSRNSRKQRSVLMPDLIKQQRDLQRKLDAAQNTYKNLLKSLQQVEIAENQNIGNAQVISDAVIAKDPVSMSKKLILGGGILTGGLLYILTAFLLDLTDPSIKTAKEARSLLNYKTLGLIPSSKKRLLLPGTQTEDIAPEHQLREAPNSMVSHAYKMLQTNLKLLNADENLQVIAISSSIPQEGKSTVSANLAAAMSEMGNRVLLVDADLHHPKQHLIWELSNDIGLNEVLSNQTHLSQAVKPVMPNLDVLTSGAIPINSLALLTSERMQLLVEYLRKKYDFIIFDTPPILLVADILTLSKETDGILMVVRPGVVDPNSVTASRELLEQSKQKVLGVVINDVVVENEPNSYYRYAKAYANNDSRSSSAIVKS